MHTGIFKLKGECNQLATRLGLKSLENGCKNSRKLNIWKDNSWTKTLESRLSKKSRGGSLITKKMKSEIEIYLFNHFTNKWTSLEEELEPSISKIRESLKTKCTWIIEPFKILKTSFCNWKHRTIIIKLTLIKSKNCDRVLFDIMY